MKRPTEPACLPTFGCYLPKSVRACLSVCRIGEGVGGAGAQKLKLGVGVKLNSGRFVFEGATRKEKWRGGGEWRPRYGGVGPPPPFRIEGTFEDRELPVCLHVESISTI